jgi:hypothetical protein
LIQFAAVEENIMASGYLKLSGRTWLQLRYSWGAPITRFLIKQCLLALMRAPSAILQSCLLRFCPIAKNPAFILGFWRSGTTLLHELLSLDDRFCSPSTYDTVHPHHFVFSSVLAHWRSRETVRRPQDDMTMGWRTPQEDEFALLALGARSPYEGLLIPRFYEEAFHLADPSELSAPDRRRWERLFVRFLKGVALINGGRRIFLKSPAHGYRVQTIRKLFPEARFIVIVRNPFEILESMAKTYYAFAARFGLGTTLPGAEVRAVILRERLRFEEKLRAGLIGHPKEYIVQVKYEQLVADPVGTIKAIYEHLGFPDFEYVRPKLIQDLVKRRGYAQKSAIPNPYWTARAARAWRDLFAQYDYPLPEDRAPRAQSVPHTKVA